MSGRLWSIAGMSLGTLLSRLTGFVKWALMGAVLGFTPLADAYNLAHILPNMIYELVLGGILSAVFIPVVVEQLAGPDRDRAWRDISRMTNAALLVLGAVTLACWGMSRWLVDVQTIGIAPERRQLVWFFFILFVPQVFLYGLSALAGGVLNARGRFAAAAYAPVLNNLAVIAALAAYRWLPGFGKVGLGLGTTAGVLVQFLAQYPSLRRAGWRYHPGIDLRHPAVAKILRLSGPVLLYVIFNQINLTVQNNLAIRCPGGVSALQYAFAFYILPHGLFAVSIGTVLLPELSGLAVRQHWEGFARAIERGIVWSGLVILPALAVYTAFSFPIVQVLMQRGRIGAQDTRMLATVLSCYSAGLFSFTLYLFLNRAFYSLQDTATPLLLNVAGNAVNTVFNLALVGVLGVPGLALGHATAYTVIAVMGLILLKRRVAAIDLRSVLRSLGRIATAALVTAAVAWAAGIGWQWWLAASASSAKVVALAAALTALAGVYAAACALLGVPELSRLAAALRQRAVRGGVR
ncbi:MAG: murein biosynthesis integral membrane protein MurJ [Candidatus Edwardsbacteria bacterium]|jgi:putative peptidoglycan lipid II flippase|nr:murein biosynthesis integral membrane protein MurJ [Candidatus Edwardsbacteria bacterium]